jgi:hypothetical protein
MVVSRYEFWHDTILWYKDYNETLTGTVHFWKPKFKLEILKGKPCVTVWLYDWILDFGYFHIMARTDKYNKELRQREMQERKNT